MEGSNTAAGLALMGSIIAFFFTWDSGFMVCAAVILAALYVGDALSHNRAVILKHMDDAENRRAR